MPFFESLTDFLTGSVGNNLDNAPEDVSTTKTNLNALGYFDDDTDNGYITRELDTGIKNFQKDNDLKVDGVLRPGGETERAIYEAVTQRPSDEAFGPDPMKQEGASIGFGTGISTLSELQEAAYQQAQSKSEAPEKTEKPRSIFSLLEEEEKDTSPVQYDATGRMISPTKSAKQPPLPPEKPPKEPPVPNIKPEVISPSRKGNEILDLIGKLESSDNYNVLVGGDEAPLTKMTIKEVQNLQKEMYDRGSPSTAIGRYQFLQGTLKEEIKKLGIDENELFDEKMQDKLARSRMEYRGFDKYKAGKMSTETLIRNLSDEWAALPRDTSNKSSHDGVLDNKALTKFQTFKKLIEKP